MDEVIEIGGARVLHCAKEGALLAREADINDFIGTAFSHQADVVAIPVERLGPDFLKLSTGLAGATFQKMVNYQLKGAIVGDIGYPLERCGPLRDFVRETNKGSSIWFVPGFEVLKEKLLLRAGAA